jgi:type IV secretory pathway VirB4 component
VAEALEGQVIRLAPGSQHHLNPFDLPPLAADDQREPQHGDRLADQLQVLHALLEIMLADRTPEGGQTLTSTEKGVLDRALFETYRRVGITSDVRTHQRPAPLLRDLYAVLESGVCGPDPTGLTQRLRRYVSGSLSGLFAGPTNVNVRGEVIVFDVHDLETELRPVGLFLVSNFVWKESFQSRIPRQLIVDEAATLYQYSSGARFLEDLVRRARKYYLGVTVISQHPLLFRDSSIIANCAVQILLRQDATALDLIGQMFKLSSREIQVVRRLGVGEALLLVGEQRMQVRGVVSPLEHQLATTNPRELAGWHTQTQQAPAGAPAEQPQQGATRAKQQEERHVAPVPSQRVEPRTATPERQGGGNTTPSSPQQFALRRVRMHALPDEPGKGSQPDEA